MNRAWPGGLEGGGTWPWGGLMGFRLGEHNSSHLGHAGGRGINKCLVEWVTFLLGACLGPEDVEQPINKLITTNKDVGQLIIHCGYLLLPIPQLNKV